jgi:hypothetical protein
MAASTRSFKTPNPLAYYWRKALSRKRIGAENLVTEFFAAAIDTSPRFQRDYLRLVLRDHAKERGWRTPLRITKVTTVNMHKSVKPDMILTLSTRDGDKKIWCEHKMVSPEGTKDGETQIVRYLKNSNSHAVLYVRGDRKGFDTDALKGQLTDAEFRKYVQPSHRRADLRQRRKGEGQNSKVWGCFVWNDFDHILEQRSSSYPIVGWLHALLTSADWKLTDRRRRVVRNTS